MWRIPCHLILLMLLATGSASAQSDADYLRWISGVGQMLADYYASLDVATGAIRDQGGEVPDVYAAGPYDDGWAFSFGALDADTVFVIRYGVIVAGDGSVITLDTFDERREASPYHTLAARAQVAVKEDAQRFRDSRPEFTADAYRVAVLPFPRGQMTAFVSPAQTRPDVTLMGNDLMYVLSRQTIEAGDPTRFHHRLIPVPTTPPPGGVVSLIVPDAPMPSPVDVLHAIERKIPLVVLATQGVFRIQPDGSVERLPDDDPLAKAVRESVQGR